MVEQYIRFSEGFQIILFDEVGSNLKLQCRIHQNFPKNDNFNLHWLGHRPICDLNPTYSNHMIKPCDKHYNETALRPPVS